MTISYVTSHGTFNIEVKNAKTWLELIMGQGIPWSGIASFSKEKGSQKWEPVVLLDKSIADTQHFEEICLVNKRNIRPLFEPFRNIGINTQKSEGPGTSEFLYRVPGNQLNYVQATLTTEDCLNIVKSNVNTAVETYIKGETAKIVVGISGGGDSNSLIHSLKSSTKKIDIIPVMLLGAPEWDLGAERAKFLCEKYDLKLRLMTDEMVKKRLGLNFSEPIYSKFKSIFGNDDFEFMGTLLIRLILTQIAKEESASYICTGANLEDILADVFYALNNNKKPLPRPIIPLKEVPLFSPLWLTPKKIIDGCYPSFSKENYETRPPCVSEGRSMYYQMALFYQSYFPGMAEQFLQTTCSPLISGTETHFIEPELGFEVIGALPVELKEKLLKIFKNT